MSADPFDLSHDPIAQRVLTGLAKIGLALRSHAWHEAVQRGLTPTQAQVLALLRRRSGRSVRMSDIAEELAVTPATVSDTVAALTRKGLVQKMSSPLDARAMVVTLTAAGRWKAEHIAGWPDLLMDAIDALSPTEQEVFLQGLIKIIRGLQERGQIPVAQMCVTCRFFRPYVHTDPDRPHHCLFVDAPFGNRHLRLDCPDQEAATPEEQRRIWDTLITYEA